MPHHRVLAHVTAARQRDGSRRHDGVTTGRRATTLFATPGGANSARKIPRCADERWTVSIRRRCRRQRAVTGSLWVSERPSTPRRRRRRARSRSGRDLASREVTGLNCAFNRSLRIDVSGHDDDEVTNVEDRTRAHELWNAAEETCVAAPEGSASNASGVAYRVAPRPRGLAPRRSASPLGSSHLRHPKQ